MKPEYSVIIPAYNSEKTIEKSLLSVLRQSLLPIEVIIIDDCSADKTLSLVKNLEPQFTKLGISFFCRKLDCNSGPARARNTGMSYVNGSYIAFLDADDFWHKDKLKIIDSFVAQSNAGFFCHSYSVESLDNAYVCTQMYYMKSFSVYRMLLRNPGQTSCVVIRKDLGMFFYESMRYSEDYDLWIRIADAADALILYGPALTTLSRPQLTSGGLSGNRLRMRVGEIIVYYRFCSKRFMLRLLLFPLLFSFSLIKHFYSIWKIHKK